MRHHFRSVLLLGTCLLGLSACSIGQKSSPSRFYVLSSTATKVSESQFEGEAPKIGISQIEIPSYLDRPQMVTAVSPNELTYNEFNRWGEPLDQGIVDTLRLNLTAQLGIDKVTAFPWMQSFPRDYNVQVVVENFEAHSYRNEVVLRAIYRIETLKDKRETVFVAEKVYTQPVAGDSMDYDAVVLALSNTLSRLSSDIADSLKTVHSEACSESSATKK